jgi:hypothetical protein
LDCGLFFIGDFDCCCYAPWDWSYVPVDMFDATGVFYGLLFMFCLTFKFFFFQKIDGGSIPWSFSSIAFMLLP